MVEATATEDEDLQVLDDDVIEILHESILPPAALTKALKAVISKEERKLIRNGKVRDARAQKKIDLDVAHFIEHGTHRDPVARVKSINPRAKAAPKLTAHEKNAVNLLELAELKKKLAVV